MDECRTVAPAGTEPASPGFQPDADPSQLESHGRGDRIRTGDLRAPNAAGWPNFPTPQSGWQESDPHVPNAALCQGATTRPVEVVGIGPTAATLARRARYLSCHPQVPAGWQPAGLALGTHAVELAITGHVHPAGWCSQGRKDLNPHQRGLEPATLPLRHALIQLETAPSGSSGGRLLVAELRCYPEASRPTRPLPWAAMRCENGDAAACRSHLMTDQNSTGCLSFQLPQL